MSAVDASRTEGRAGRLLSARRALLCLVAAGSAVVWVWWIGWPQGAEATQRLAEEEQRSRSTDTWVLLACVASLAAVVVALVQASSRRDGTAVTAVLLAVLAVVVSWALVNTVFALKYARLYYLGEPDHRGIAFGAVRSPCYADFAYMAFTVGMSFAVSETEPDSTDVRKVALGHALLSYAFGTGVLAVAVTWSPTWGSDLAAQTRSTRSAWGPRSLCRTW